MFRICECKDAVKLYAAGSIRFPNAALRAFSEHADAGPRAAAIVGNCNFQISNLEWLPLRSCLFQPRFAPLTACQGRNTMRTYRRPHTSRGQSAPAHSAGRDSGSTPPWPPGRRRNRRPHRRPMPYASSHKHTDKSENTPSKCKRNANFFPDYRSEIRNVQRIGSNIIRD